jgi:hypothetical protein
MKRGTYGLPFLPPQFGTREYIVVQSNVSIFPDASNKHSIISADMAPLSR